MKNLKYSVAVSCVSCRKEITTSGLTRHLKKGCYNISGSVMPRKPRVAWNKGLTKEHPSVARYAEKNTTIIRAKVAAGEWFPHKPTQQELANTSARMSLHNPGGRSKWFEVSGQKVQGTWERDIAIKFNELGILWNKPSTNTFIWKWNDSGTIRSYTPDFYLPELNIYLEIKGYWWGNDRYKMQQVLQNYPDKRLIIVEQAGYEKIMRGELVW